jgi:hypothetical protein
MKKVGVVVLPASALQPLPGPGIFPVDAFMEAASST